MVSHQSISEYRLGLTEDEAFARDSLTIQDNKGNLCPFVWNAQQHKLTGVIHEQREKNLPVRVRILKYRRGGLSTGIAGHLFGQTALQSGQNTLILAHEKTAARNLFSMYDRFQERFRPFKGKVVLPELVGRTAGQESGALRWANGSTIQIATAKNIDFGRSFNFRRLHLSERAFYPNIKALTAALSATVPDDPDTWVIEETTANGYGEFFKDWKDSLDGKTSYVPLFFGCFEDPLNVREIGERPDLFQESLTDDEWELKRRYSLSLEQLNWRRHKIANDYRGDEAVFDQEYPHSWEVAFLVSGRPRFNPKLFIHMPIIEQPEVGGLTVEKIGTRERAVFYPRPHGELTIFKRPEQHKQYVGGVDPSKGVDVNEGSGSPDPDYSVACLFDLGNGEQVAKLRERLSPPILAQYLFDLGHFYNGVYWVIEVEFSGGNGQAVVNELLRLGYPRSLLHQHRDPSTGMPTEKFGYHIVPVSRTNLIAEWERMLWQREIVLHDQNTIAEHLSFVIKTNGNTTRIEHQEGCHDDEVFAAMYGGIGLTHCPARAINLPEIATSQNPFILKRQQKQGALRRY